MARIIKFFSSAVPTERVGIVTLICTDEPNKQVGKQSHQDPGGLDEKSEVKYKHTPGEVTDGADAFIKSMWRYIQLKKVKIKIRCRLKLTTTQDHIRTAARTGAVQKREAARVGEPHHGSAGLRVAGPVMDET